MSLDPGILATTSAGDSTGSIYQFLRLFHVAPSTALYVQSLAKGPLIALLILLVAVVLSRMERRLSRRFIRSFRLVAPFMRSAQRREERARTLAAVTSAIVRSVIWVTAILAALNQLDVKLTAFVAGATIIGAALGFGAQSLVKDFLSGILILAEDQYGIGDTIELNSMVAIVERFTLRVTRLRALDGVVWYVPNGEIRKVGNHSDGTSQAVIDIPMPVGTDLRAAAAVAEREAQSMASEPQWASIIVATPVVAGIETSTVDSATLRLLCQTPPAHHFRVQRELRLRILESLRIEGVAFASNTSS